MGFVVAGQAAVGGAPGQGPLHDPAAGVHDEASLVSGFADDLQGGAQQVPGPVHQAAGEAGVGDDVPDRGGRVGSEQGSFGAVAVLPGAARTQTVTSRPRVSVTMNRSRPLIFLPAS